MRDRNINVLCYVPDTEGFIRKSHDIILDTSTCTEQFMTTVSKIYFAYSLKVYFSATTFQNQSRIRNFS